MFGAQCRVSQQNHPPEVCLPHARTDISDVLIVWVNNFCGGGVGYLYSHIYLINYQIYDPSLTEDSNPSTLPWLLFKKEELDQEEVAR